MAAGTTTRIPAQHRREQILDVAMELFARQGFQGTTTRKIAQSARVNEAIIFRHFPTKDDLYSAIIERKCQAAAKPKVLRERLREPRSPREIFTELAADILQRSPKDANLTRLLFFSALEDHELSHRFFRTYIADRYETIAEYISDKIAEGVFRPVDPLLAARGFLGMVVYHFLIQELFNGKRYHQFEPRAVGEALVDIWLRGISAEGETVKSAKTNGNGSHPTGNGHTAPRNRKSTRARS